VCAAAAAQDARGMEVKSPANTTALEAEVPPPSTSNSAWEPVSPDAAGGSGDVVIPFDPDSPASAQGEYADEMFEGNQLPDRPSTAHIQLQKRVSNKFNDKEDWNVMRGQPPLSCLWLLLCLPFVIVRVFFIVLAVLNLIFFWSIARCWAACCGCVRRRPMNPADTCFLPAATSALLPLASVFTRVRMHPSAGTEKLCAETFDRAPFIVANHLCYLDAVAIGSKLPRRCKFVAKAGVRKIPVLGSLIARQGTIFVDRGSKASKGAVIEKIKAHAETYEAGNTQPLTVFPEGTVSNGKSIIPFKKGIFVAGKPVRPVLLHYRNGLHCCRRNRWKAGHCTFISAGAGSRGHTARVVPSASGEMQTSSSGEEKIFDFTNAMWFRSFFARLFVVCYITVYPMYEPSSEETSDPELYAQNVHEYLKEEYAKLLSDFGEVEEQVLATTLPASVST